MSINTKGKEQINPIIRAYQPGDEDQITKLLIEVFKKWPVYNIECPTVDHWKWKFVDNPANNGINAHVVAEFNGEIIGVTHGMWFRTKIGDGSYFSSKGADVAVHPNYQGVGLYSKITKHKHALYDKVGWQFNYSLTQNERIIKSKLRQENKEDKGDFPYLIKVFIKIENVGDFIKLSRKESDPWRSLYLKIGLTGLKLLNKLTNISLSTPDPPNVKFSEISRFDERINKFYNKVKPNYNFLVEKKIEHMNWRYCDKRGGDYKVWIAEKDDEILGYLVLRVNTINKNNPVGYIIDLLALNEREDIIDYFVKFAVQYFKKKNLNEVTTQLVEGHKYERQLSKYGFIDSRDRLNIRYRKISIGEDLQKFLTATPTMLHYPYGESDSI